MGHRFTNTLLWRGVIRSRTRGARDRLNSMLAYNSKHPERSFLDADEKDTIVATVAICQRILDEKSNTGFPTGARVATPPTDAGASDRS
jgi:hypothetical protein